MALTYTQITAITEKLYIKKLTDGIYRSNALLARLSRPNKMMLKDGGTSIMQPIINSKPGSGGYYSVGEPLTTDATDNITSAEFQWKNIYESIRVWRQELLMNSGDAAKLNLIASKIQIAEKQIKNNLALGLYSDGTAATGALTTKQLTGLRALLSTSSTYGGIAVADFAEWIAVVKNNSSVNRALSLPLLQQADGAATEDDEKPTVLVMKQNVMDQLWSLYQPHQRLMSEEMSALGFDNVLTFNGKPCLVDSYMKDNSIFGLNENHVFLVVHKDENMRKESIEKLESTNGMLTKIYWMGNLVCSNRRFNFELADIEVAS